MDDGFVEAHNERFNNLTWEHQSALGEFIADYPNYISPNVSGHRVWGDNVDRLINIKAKYDPDCQIHQGRVFAAPECVRGGWANIYPAPWLNG